MDMLSKKSSLIKAKSRTEFAREYSKVKSVLDLLRLTTK